MPCCYFPGMARPLTGPKTKRLWACSYLGVLWLDPVFLLQCGAIEQFALAHHKPVAFCTHHPGNVFGNGGDTSGVLGVGVLEHPVIARKADFGQ